MDTARTWIPRGLAAFAFCVYAVLVPPGMYWLDSPELSAAAVRLGSPHPTGFPLFCLLGKAAQFVPFGEISFRINLMCAGAAALAVLWTSRLTLELARNDTAGLVGAITAGATLMTSLVFARHATAVEVYAPTAALMAGALLIFYRAVRDGTARHGLLLAVICGLGLGTHTTFLLIGPVIAGFVLVRLYRGARWPLSAPLLAILIAGALYTYLPVRSATGRIAPVDWDHPRDASGLLTHVTAERIRDAFGDEMRSTTPEIVVHDATAFADGVVESLGPIVPITALFGLIWLYRQRRLRWSAAMLTTVIVGDVVYSIWLNPMGAVDAQNTVPLSLCLCTCTGVALAWFARYLGRVGPYVGAVLGLVTVAMPALDTMREVEYASSGDVARAFCEAGLQATPSRGVALTRNDSTAAGMIYLTAAEGARPDVAVLVRQHFADIERVRAILTLAGNDPSAVADRDLFNWTASKARAITWEVGPDAPPQGTLLLADAPLARLARTPYERDRVLSVLGEDTKNPRIDVRAAVDTLERLFDHDSRDDRAAKRTRANALTALGRVSYGRNDVEFADLLFAFATDVDESFTQAWVNRGVTAASRGEFDNALKHVERALDIEPNKVKTLINAARYAIQLNLDERARSFLQRALRVDQNRPDAWALRGFIAFRGGRQSLALEHLARARALDPQHPDVVSLQRLVQPNPESATP